MKTLIIALFISLFTTNPTIAQEVPPTPSEEVAPDDTPPPIPEQEGGDKTLPPPIVEPAPEPIPVPTEAVVPGRDLGNVTMRPTLTTDGVTYGHPEKGLVSFAWNGVGYDPNQVHHLVDELYALKPSKPPLHWQATFNTLETRSLSVECIWRMSGKWEDVKKAIDSQDRNAPASWYWVEGMASTQPLQIRLRIDPESGQGAMFLFKGEQYVGRTRCLTSSKKDKQLPQGDYPVLAKGVATDKAGVPYKDSGEVVARMYYPLRLQDSTGKYLHAGNGALDQAETAHGCIRAPGLIMRLVYDGAVVRKTVVSVIYVTVD